ncbi:MAG: YihY/virulence factor BrkB family protein [Bryobacteraceae bacterium]
MTIRQTKHLLSAAFSKWNEHHVPRLGAALAYYALLSAAPLLILVIEICGLVLDKSTAERELFRYTAEFVGPGAAHMLNTAIDSAHQKTGIVASSIAAGTLFIGASGFFVDLRDALNTIWDAPPPQVSAIRGLVTDRLKAFAMILSLGIFVAASLLGSAAFAVVEKYFRGFVPLHTAILGEVLNFIVSVVVVALLFGLIFRFVPNVRIDWEDVSFGAFVSSVLFMIGKSALAIYFSTAGFGSTYGAAGSIVAFVAWMYYSAQIFLFGAIFTRVFADEHRSYALRRQRDAADRAAQSN